MSQLTAIMRGMEVHKILGELKSLDPSATKPPGVGGQKNRYQRQNVNFIRRMNKRRNQADVDRILTKFSTIASENRSRDSPASRKQKEKEIVPKREREWEQPGFVFVESSADVPSVDVAKKCVATKKRRSFLGRAKSEMNLSQINSIGGRSERSLPSYDFGKYNYRTKSCNSILEECSDAPNPNFKSKNFDEISIMVPRAPIEPSANENMLPAPLSTAESQVETYNSQLSDKISLNSYSDEVVMREKPKDTLPNQRLTGSRNTIICSSSDNISEKPQLRSILSRSVCENLPEVSNKPKNRFSMTFSRDKGSPSPGKSSPKRWRFPPLRKGTFDCLVRWRGRKVGHCDKTIQEIDDSFFEKFGSILHQRSVEAELYDSTHLSQLHNPEQLPVVVEEPAKDGEESQAEGEGSPTGLRSRNGETDSGNETLLDTDSEEDDPEKMDLYVEAVGWNIDELYAEILYEILHNVGCDVSLEIGQLALLSYLQDAFKIANDKHQQLLTEAEAKQPPDILLNVEVIEAKDLQPKDPNGLSDPFVTIYLTSNSTHRFNTSVKYTTLSPVWEEHFSLPISENPAEDTLCIEVWDFDPAETVKEKMTKIFEVKGVKGLRKLMKEIAITASTGKHDNELVGRAHIPLKTIPASGMTMWYSLDKKNKLRRQGVVKVRLAFSSQKNSQVATQEHRHLLRMLLLHELESSKVAPYWWCGNFSAQAEAIITQHAAQSGLGQNENNLAQWTVYCAVHGDHALSFALFDNILSKLLKPIQSGAICDEETKLFWDGVKKLLPSCFGAIRRIRRKTAGDKNVMKMLKEILQILYRFSSIDIPESVDLFPQSIYEWLRFNEDGTRTDIKEILTQATDKGASDWFIHIQQNNESKDKSEEGKLQNLIRVIQLVRSDLQRAVEFYDKVFLEMMNFPYAKTLYCLYESKISSLVEPEVTQVCKRLKRLRFNEDTGQSQVKLADELNGGSAIGLTSVEGEPMSMGTTLFELYLVLQRFLTLGQGLCPADWNSFTVAKFHSWFFGGVAQWLDIAVFKALTRIEKAVELDQLVPVDATVKYSSSAVDTLAIFYQIKIFWQQLAWPDVEGCYTFVAKIIDDICRCSVFYADKMSQRVDGLGMISNMYENKFQVTTEWCLAINNIDYVRQSLQPFVSELGMDDIISRLCELRSALEAQRCKETLQNVIENAIDTVKNKIIELLEKVVKKMMPSITRFLVEGAELLHQDCSSMERVMLYLEDNLDTLYKNLNQDNFTRTLDIVWEQLSNVLYQLIQSNLEKRRPPSFFANLHQCVKIMVKSFKQDNIEDHSCETLQRIEHLLELNGFETAELIHQYHLERWQEQKSLEEPTYGMLTVRAHFVEGDLKIEVINARNLAPMDSNGLCDSFVRIHLLPEDVFATAVKPKTQTHTKNVFPLYDEVFTISLSNEQRNCKDGLIAFIVKDKDLFGMSNQLIGEGFLHFGDIPDTPVDIATLPQIHIILSRPTKSGSDSIKALEHRQGDKQAKEFLKKQRQKMSSS